MRRTCRGPEALSGVYQSSVHGPSGHAEQGCAGEVVVLLRYGVSRARTQQPSDMAAHVGARVRRQDGHCAYGGYRVADPKLNHASEDRSAAEIGRH